MEYQLWHSTHPRFLVIVSTGIQKRPTVNSASLAKMAVNKYVAHLYNIGIGYYFHKNKGLKAGIAESRRTTIGHKPSTRMTYNTPKASTTKVRINPSVYRNGSAIVLSGSSLVAATGLRKGYMSFNSLWTR